AAGRAAEQSRNAALAAGGEGEEIAFDDLLLLARVIDCEAGSDWLTDDFRLCVGEVVLNRVASPEFPDTLREVVYQRGQYGVVNSARFSGAPRRDCVDAALRLLQGERRMVPAVVFQSDSLQGELFTMYSDRRLGNTYFCLSERLELYP
ncbi:MAG: cell wall hydrolase, partial [Oscillospiraceae bacterium]|nr:cell wall hydrolase [Oscillospiraceae bacterium]